MIDVPMAVRVKYVLGAIPETRISDQELYKNYMSMFHRDSVICEGDKFYVEICDGLPQQQDISRCRRNIQENGLYTAPEEIRKERQLLSKKAHDVLDDITSKLKEDIARTIGV